MSYSHETSHQHSHFVSASVISSEDEGEFPSPPPHASLCFCVSFFCLFLSLFSASSSFFKSSPDYASTLWDSDSGASMCLFRILFNRCYLLAVILISDVDSQALASELRGALVRYPCSAVQSPQLTKPAKKVPDSIEVGGSKGERERKTRTKTKDISKKYLVSLVLLGCLTTGVTSMCSPTNS